MTTTTDTRTLPERLHDNPLLSHCTLRDRKIVARHLELLDIPTNTTIARSSEIATNFFFILRGELQATTTYGVRTIGAGGFVGELGLLQRGTNHEDLITRQPTQLGALGARMFHVLLRDLPPFTTALMADLAHRAATTRTTAEEASHHSGPTPAGNPWTGPAQPGL